MRDVHLRIMKDEVTHLYQEGGQWYFSYRAEIIVCSHLRHATGLLHECTSDAEKANEKEQFIQKWLPAIVQEIEEVEHRKCIMCGRCKSHFVKWKNIG